MAVSFFLRSQKRGNEALGHGIDAMDAIFHVDSMKVYMLETIWNDDQQ